MNALERLAAGLPPPSTSRVARNELRRLQAAREEEQDTAFRALALERFKKRECLRCGAALTGRRARFDSEEDMCKGCEG